MSKDPNDRILVIDDDPSLHEDIRLYLTRGIRDRAFEEETKFLFGTRPRPPGELPEFDMEFAFQGKDGLRLAREAMEAGRPFSVGFVDMRMPPGWDGLETIERLWELDPELQLVLCTAYSDHTWQEIARRLVNLENLLILRKPYDKAEVRQIACALSTKRRLNGLARLKMDDLALMVAGRTRELEEARRVAETADRVKTNFLATMAHEMRTPLNSLLGLVDLMAIEQDSPHIQEQLRLMAVSGQSLVRLINLVLDHGKIEGGHERFEPTEFNLKKLISDLVATQKVMAEQRGLELTAEFEGVPEWVYGDKAKLDRVLTNLVGNALSFTTEGQVEVRVKAEGDELTFEVNDTGCGIPAEELEAIFEPYHQATRLNKRIAGTGLGLAISRRLVEVMGGQLQVESRVDEGSVFSFTVSLPGADAPAERSKGPELVDLSGMSVLVVEDDPLCQKVAGSLLAKLGAEVKMARQGQDALRQLESNRIDLVLLDLRMPGMDGYETIAKIRSSTANYAGVLVVALTAEVGEEERRRCLEVGMDAYVQKPIRMKSLCRAIQQAGENRV